MIILSNMIKKSLNILGTIAPHHSGDAQKQMLFPKYNFQYEGDPPPRMRHHSHCPPMLDMDFKP